MTATKWSTGILLVQLYCKLVRDFVPEVTDDKEMKKTNKKKIFKQFWIVYFWISVLPYWAVCTYCMHDVIRQVSVYCKFRAFTGFQGSHTCGHFAQNEKKNVSDSWCRKCKNETTLNLWHVTILFFAYIFSILMFSNHFLFCLNAIHFRCLAHCQLQLK